MIRRLVLLAAIGGSLALPLSVSATTPTFKLILTSPQTAIKVGGGPITFTLWNYSSEPQSITVTAGAPWATPEPSAFTVDAGMHQDVLVSVTPGAHGKTTVTFSTDPAMVGTVRVTRAIASTIWVGVLPPRPKPLPVPVDLRPWLGALLMLVGLVALVGLLRRRPAPLQASTLRPLRSPRTAEQTFGGIRGRSKP